MIRSYVLVLGCDLSEDGSELGPMSIARLEFALKYANSLSMILVLAAGMSPRPQHGNQKKTMAMMMADWLSQKNFYDVLVLRANVFNTRGELETALTGLCGQSLAGVIGGKIKLPEQKIWLERFLQITYKKLSSAQLLVV